MSDASRFSNCIIKSSFGDVIVVWRKVDNMIVRVFLPNQRRLFMSSVYKDSEFKQKPNQVIRALCSKIGALLNGQSVDFNLGRLDWSLTYHFQKRVLRMEHRIPRGLVSTYGRLAKKLGKPHAARAVGTALARNPFPLIISCHRAIRSDGSLGGYAGGLAMKQRLLEFEGVQFDKHGRVVTKKFW
jgi:methylated-DNA-[protein]-cysteine S-methyltransferase